MSKIKVLPIKNIDAALKAYYGAGYLGNKDIGEIFGIRNPSTIYNIKKPVIEKERAANMNVVVPHHVNAKIAFSVWGLDVSELERNRKKLKSLGLE